MSHTKLIAVPCHISEGIVSDERAFELTLVNGEVHTGAAPRFYFWNDHDRQLALGEPHGAEEIDGKVAARLLERRNGHALVSIPDGKVVLIDSSLITDRPSEISFDVPIGP